MPVTVELPALMSQREAAAYLGCSPKKLERDRWCEKKIPFVRMGRIIRYRAEDLRAFFDANIVEAQP